MGKVMFNTLGSFLVTVSVLAALVNAMSTSTLAAASSLPTVDLGFNNIRYAAPPLGDLRFATTEAPLRNRSAGVQDGSYGNICPQAFATWQVGAASLNPGASNENEDCLFLDVVVPKAVFDGRHVHNKKPAPVSIWLHGGGYTLGSKNSDPTGFLDQSLNNTSGGQIWVGINYRLGPFGWLNGPQFANSGGTPNAALYDQRAAFEWVQEHVDLFGGDPDQVTVMGESAGAGSILHHITAYGGSKSSPFNQALLQSPAFIPKLLKNQSDTSFEIFLAAANVSTLAQAKKLDTLVLQQASKIAQTKTFFGTFQFGPAPDGSYVPDLPGKLLLSGKFDKSLTILAAHNTNEAGRYTPPTTSTSDNFTTYMLLYFPQISPTALSYLTTTLYPPIYDGSQPYITPFHRLDLAISDFTFTCSTAWLGRAFKNQTHNYIFSVSPGNHTQDVPYTFYNGASSAVANSTLAVLMQRYLTTFVENGDPNRAGLPRWGVFGTEGEVLNFNQTFTDFRVDEEVAGKRCEWWQQALYGDDW